MKYYQIKKTDVKNELKEIPTFKNGYRFSTKIDITLYDRELTASVLVKKIDSSFRQILKMLIELENSEEGDEEGANILAMRIETMRNIIMEKYLPYIGATRAKVYLLKLQEIGSRLPDYSVKKSRHR